MEISKKVYIRGDNALERVKNLEKVAVQVTRGNFSEMTIRAYVLAYGLDPHTLAPTGKISDFCPTGAPKRPIRSGHKK